MLRQQYDVPDPLADRRPFVNERQLVIEAQEKADLAPEFCLVAIVCNQRLLTPPAEEFFERVGWDGDVAASWRPHEDRRSPVRMDPELRFGRPAVGGISTEVLWEHVDAGEGVDGVAEAFDLTVDEVRWALSYETANRAV